jgi:hypothetical protein
MLYYTKNNTDGDGYVNGYVATYIGQRVTHFLTRELELSRMNHRTCNREQGAVEIEVCDSKIPLLFMRDGLRSEREK